MRFQGWRTLGIAVATASLGLAAPAFAANITLTQISTAFNSPIGIDYYEPTNEVVISVNYNSGGAPYNFETVAYDGSHAQFSTVSGLTDEVKIATARSAANGGYALSGFAAGTLFVGNGVDGQIARLTNGGTTVVNPWVDLPGAGNGLMRGSLYVDRTGVWGGDLIVATTAGEVWRINSAGTATLVADVGVHLEGLVTVPNNPAKYGGMAGKILAGAEGQARLYSFDTAGNASYWSVPVLVEDLDMIMPNENFFGVNFGTGKILGAPASEFASMVDDILVTEEFGAGFSPASKLSRLTWDFINAVPKLEAIGLTGESAAVGQWEHVTFAAAGIVEIPPTETPEPATLALFGMAAAALGLMRRRRR